MLAQDIFLAGGGFDSATSETSVSPGRNSRILMHGLER